MANQSIDPKVLASFPIASIVYPDEGTGFDSRSEWSRIAGDLEQQEKDEKESEDSSDSSEVKFFRVDQKLDPYDEDRDEPTRWFFPISSRLIEQERSFDEAPPGTVLESMMADELHSLYCLNGSTEVVRLGDSITDSYFTNLDAFEEGYENGTREKEEQFAKRTDVLAARRMVNSVYVRQLGALLDRIKEHQKQVTKEAVKIAYAKLEEASTEILAEAMRYLPPTQKASVSTQTLLESDPMVHSGGPRFLDLLDATARINSRFQAVDHPPPAEPNPFAILNNLPVTSPAEDAAHALEYEISQACLRFPVLHRTWKLMAFTPFPYNDTLIFGALSQAWRSNRRLRDRIANDPDVVWQFPALIHETVEQLSAENPDYGDLELGARAAQDLLDGAENRITETLAKIVGLLDLAAAVTSPAPPIAFSIAAASLVFSLADSLVEYQQLSAKDDAANAALDPRKALSSDPSYLFFGLGIAFSLLDVWGLPKAYRAAGRVAQEVDELGKVVKEAS